MTERRALSRVCWLLLAAGAALAGLADAQEPSPSRRLALERELADRLSTGADAADLLAELAHAPAAAPRSRPTRGNDGSAIAAAIAAFSGVARGDGPTPIGGSVQGPGGGRTATAPGSGLGVPPDALLAAYERLRSQDLLYRNRLDGVRRRLEASGASGEIVARFERAESEYLGLLDPVVAPVERVLARWREASREASEGEGPTQSGARASRDPQGGTVRSTTADVALLRRELHTALLAAAEQLAAHRPSQPRILRASSLPHRPLGLAPRPPVVAPTVRPAYLDPTDPAPTAADFASAPETPLSASILVQAEALQHDPVAIFEFVRNEISTEWYAGAMKGAEETLRQRSGNDVDQATLLVALLRASSQPCRYVHGVVELPLGQAAASLGVTEGPQVQLALARAGVAHRPVIRGGRLAAVEVEHTWVTARLPYGNYRGAVVDLSARTWVPLAPALKSVEGVPPTGVLQQMGFDAAAFVTAQLASPAPSDPLTTLRQHIQAWLAVHVPGATYEEQLGSRSVAAQRLGLVPSSLPAAVVAVTGEEASLGAFRLHRIEILLREGEGLDDPAVLVHAMPVFAAADRRMTLSYLPATTDDHQTINLFGGLDAVPPYLVNLRAQLRVQGRLEAIGEGTFAMAARQRLEVRLVSPAGSVETTQSVIAGGLHALVLGAGRFVGRPDPVGQAGDGEGAAARLLAQAGLAYGAAWDLAADELAGLRAVSVQRPLPSLVLVNNEVATTHVGGLAVDLEWQGVTFDAALRIAEPIARDGSLQAVAARQWLRLSSLQGSALEQRVLEERFLVEAISADEGLARARGAGATVHRVDAANVGDLLPSLLHPPAVLAAIEELALGGLVVEVPATIVGHRDWRGSLWRADDPDTGAGGYFLAGGLAGGATTVEPEDWPVQSLVDDLMAPYAADPNLDPDSAAAIFKVGGTDGQIGVVGERLPKDLAVLVLDRVGRPVSGVEVAFTSIAGGGRLGDDAGVSMLTAVTDRLGIASVSLLLGTDTESEPVYLQLSPQDDELTRMLMHEVDAALTVGDQVLRIGEPLTALGKPGPPVALRRTNDKPQPIYGTFGIWSDNLSIAVEDAHGNDVSNVGLRFSVGPMEPIERCSPSILTPTPLRNAAVFDKSPTAATGCPAHPLLGQCGGPLLELETGPWGAVAGVILGNAVNRAYRITVEAPEIATLAGTSLSYRYEQRPVHIGLPDSGDDCGTPGGLVRLNPEYADRNGRNINAVPSGGTFQVQARVYVSREPSVPCPPGVPGGTCQARGGELWYGVVPRFWLRRGDLDTNEWLSEDPLIATTGNVYRAQVEVPFGEGKWWAVGGSVTDVIDPWTGEIQHLVNDGCVIEAFYCTTSRSPLGITGITTEITSVVPQPVQLDDSGAFEAPVELTYRILPELYLAERVEVGLLEEGALVGRRPGSSPGFEGTANLPRGSRGTHAQLLVNPYSPVEVRSTPVDLRVASGLFVGVSDHIELTQDIDVPNERVCATPDVFRFTLRRPARVTLRFREVSEEGEDGRPIYGDEVVLLDDQQLEAAEHAIPVLASDLPTGLYHWSLAGVEADGATEQRTGSARSGLTMRDQLPLGHAMVEGVDLFDGRLVLSRSDLAVPGRGVALALDRTYASGDREPGILGPGWTHSYDSRIVAIPCGDVVLMGGEGSGIRFVPDGAGGLSPLRGYHGSLVPDPASFGFDFYPPGGNRYHYQASGPNEWLLDWIADPNGNVTELDYGADPEGGLRLAAVRDPSGRALRFHYEVRQFSFWGGDVLTRVDGPGGLVIAYEYDAWGNLQRAAREPHAGGGPSRVERYEYATALEFPVEDRHLLLATVDEVRNARRSFRYQRGVIPLPGTAAALPVAYVAEVVREEGGRFLLAPDFPGLGAGASELIATVTDPRDHVTTYTLNKYGAPVAIADPLGHVTRQTWDLQHVKLVSRTDANGNTTSFTYDAHGNLLSESIVVTGLDGNSRELTAVNTYWPPDAFDPPYVKNRVQTRTDRAGAQTSFEYDSRGNLTRAAVEIRDPDAAGPRPLETLHAYYPNGDLRSTTDPRGNTSFFAYDGAGNLQAVTDARGGVTATVWDERSRPVRRTDAEGRATTFAYDTLDREIERRLPSVAGDTAVRLTLYDDALGTQVAMDAEGRATLSAFDREGRPIRGENAEGATKLIAYDPAGNKTLETSWHDTTTPRQDTTFTYDDAGRLVRRDEPQGRRTVYGYDAVGNLLSESLHDAGDGELAPRATEHDYDEANRRLRTRRLFEAGETRTEQELDGEGRAVLLRDALGREVTQRFDALGRLIERIEPEWAPAEPRRTWWFYDGNGNRAREVRFNEPADRVREWEYDELDRLVRQRDGTGAETAFEYDRVGNLVREISPRLDAVAHAYDARDQRTSTTQHLQRLSGLGLVVTTFEYDRVGNLVAERHPNGNVVRHRYDRLDRPIETTDSLGAVVAAGYDARGNRAREVDANGNVTLSTFDALDRVARRDLPEGRILRYSYDVAGNLLTETNPRGHAIQHEYDRLDRRIATRDPVPHTGVRRFAYDLVGNPIRDTDRRGHTTERAYDSLNRLVEVLTPPLAGQGGTRLSTRLEYDALDNQLMEVDRRGIATERTFDREGRLLELRRANVLLETREYDVAGNLRFLTDANGGVTGYEYDERNLLTAENGALAAVATHRRDATGDVVLMIDPEGRQTTRSYDARRRLVAEANAAGEETRFELDLAGNRTARVLPKGAGAANSHRWEYDYDGAHRLVAVRDPLGNETTYVYDGNGNRTAQVDGEGRETGFTFDELDRLTDLRYADGATEGYGYDAEGHLTSRTDPKGQSFANEFDELGRQTLANFPTPVGVGADELTSISTVYDANGNPLEVQESYSGPTGLRRATFTYDLFDRQETVTDAFGKTVRYGYDAAGNRTSLTDPDGSTTRYVFDALNRLTHATLPADGGTTEYRYLRDSRLDVVLHPNGARADHTYDTAGRLLTLVSRNASGVVSSYVYRYDSNGNRIEQVEENGGGAETTGYSYDEADRLLIVEYPDSTVAYTYDGVGNRLTETRTPAGGGPALAQKAFAYDQRHRLTAMTDGVDPASNTTYTYDANGNQTERRRAGISTRFGFDARDQAALVEEELPGGGFRLLGRYTYDWQGLRVEKRTEGGVLRYTYDQQSVLLEHGVDGLTLAKYEYGPDRLLSLRHRTEGRSFYLFDALGTPTTLLSEDGSVRERVKYDAWGVVRSRVGESENRFGFTGHELDEETALYYAGARFYDPEVGRFLNEDLFGGLPDVPPSLHKYLYAHANPTFFTDPSGMCVFGWECPEAVQVAIDTAKGVAADAAQMAVGAADLVTGGAISGTRAGVQTYLGSEGTTGERVQAGLDATQRQQAAVVTLGFSEAEDKGQHAKELLGVAAVQRAGTLLGEAYAEGDGEKALAGFGELLTGAGQISSTALIAVAPAAKAGLNPTPSWMAPTAPRPAPTTPRINLAGGRSESFTANTQRAAAARAAARSTAVKSTTVVEASATTGTATVVAEVTQSVPATTSTGGATTSAAVGPRTASGPTARTTSQNAAELAVNLSRERRSPAAGQAAGHVVPSTGAKGHWAAGARSRSLLERYHIGINDAANGIPVNSPRPHNTMHTRAFLTSTEARLLAVEQQMRAQGYGHRAIRAALRRELRQIGQGVPAEVPK